MADHAHVIQQLGAHFDQFLAHCHGYVVHVQELAGSVADQDAFLHAFCAACVCDAPVVPLQKEQIKFIFNGL